MFCQYQSLDWTNEPIAFTLHFQIMRSSWPYLFTVFLVSCNFLISVSCLSVQFVNKLIKANFVKQLLEVSWTSSLLPRECKFFTLLWSCLCYTCPYMLSFCILFRSLFSLFPLGILMLHSFSKGSQHSLMDLSSDPALGSCDPGSYEVCISLVYEGGQLGIGTREKFMNQYWRSFEKECNNK